jgi:hypothetical protein
MLFPFYKTEPVKKAKRGQAFEDHVVNVLNDRLRLSSVVLRDDITLLMGTHYDVYHAELVSKQDRNTVFEQGQPLRFMNNASGETGDTVVDVELQGDTSFINLSLKDGNGWFINNFNMSPRDCAVFLTNFVKPPYDLNLIEAAIKSTHDRGKTIAEGYWSDVMKERLMLHARQSMLKLVPTFESDLNEEFIIDSICNVFWQSTDTIPYVLIHRDRSDGHVYLCKVDDKFRAALRDHLFDFSWSIGESSYVTNSGMYFKGKCLDESITIDIRSPKKDNSDKRPSGHIQMQSVSLPGEVLSKALLLFEDSQAFA